MPAPLLEVNEMYAPAKYFETIGGFKPADFFDFLRKHGIKPDPIRGYPIFAIMSQVNELRKARNASGSTNDTLNLERINKLRLENAIKAKEYISRSLAVDRMRVTLQGISSKIRYAVKMSAPRICGLQSVPDIESILTETYNTAMEQLATEAEQLISWEVYGINFQQAGEKLAPNSQENADTGSSIEDPSVVKDEHSRENRSFINSVYSTGNRTNR